MRPTRSRRFKQRKPTLNKRKKRTCKNCKKSIKMCKKNKCKSRKRRRRRQIKKGGNPYELMQEAYHGSANSVGKLYDAAFGYNHISTSPFPTSRVL